MIMNLIILAMKNFCSSLELPSKSGAMFEDTCFTYVLY